MVIDHCTLTKQSCMIHHFNQRVTADVTMYHTCLYVECTLTYDHDCTQFWRSVSAAGHGNLILKQLTRPTRVRSPDPNRHLWTTQRAFKRQRRNFTKQFLALKVQLYYWIIHFKALQTSNGVVPSCNSYSIFQKQICQR